MFQKKKDGCAPREPSRKRSATTSALFCLPIHAPSLSRLPRQVCIDLNLDDLGGYRRNEKSQVVPFFARAHHARFRMQEVKEDSPKLTIFPQPLALSSAATTPPILFPTISFLLLTNTAALSSNLTYLPSGLLVGYFVRTTTARRTSPRRTLGAAED